MIEELNNLRDLNINEKFARAVIKPIIYTKHKLGLGTNKKKTNGRSQRITQTNN